MRKLNGYRSSHRNRWLFLKHGILSLQELSLLDFYADILDFDRNKQSFGLFEVQFEELAKVFNCKSDSTVRNWHVKLLDLGFIIPTNKPRVFKLACFERYITPGFWGGKSAEYAKLEKDQPIGIILQSFGIDLQNTGKKIQESGILGADLATKDGSIALGSSKDEYKDSQRKTVIIKQALRKNIEYEKIIEEGKAGGLTIDELKDIDQEVTEKIEVSPDNEQELIDIFFGGDKEEYKRHLTD